MYLKSKCWNWRRRQRRHAIADSAVGGALTPLAGATNAGLLAAQIIGTSDDSVRKAVEQFRATQTETILDNPDPRDQ